jgi:hypothetical protein
LLPLQNWIGEVKSKDNTHFTILNLNKTVIPGPPLSIRIFVKFTEGENIPRLRSIHINGREICPADHGIIFYYLTKVVVVVVATPTAATLTIIINFK